MEDIVLKLKNELIVICLILFILISLTAVTAADNNTEIITSNGNADDNIQIINSLNDDEISTENGCGSVEISSSINQSNNVLSDADGGTFSDLNTKINTSTSSTVTLENDYRYAEDHSNTGVQITKSNIIVDGKGHTIDGNHQSRIFYVTGNDVTLKNINFINGNYTFAGAIYGYGDNLKIINCTFIGNSAPTNVGGAVYWYPDTYSSVINSTFINNSAGYGGAMCIREYDVGVTSEIINCTFIGNTAGYGGAIYGYGESLKANEKIKGSYFINNTAKEGDGIYSGGCRLNITDSIFLNNGNIAVVAASYQYAFADYNWWGNTFENKSNSPSIDCVTVNKWLYLDIIPNVGGDSATISINNVYDDETKKTTSYSTSNLPSINVMLKAINATLNTENVTLDSTGKSEVNYTLTNNALITASYDDIELTKEVRYADFKELQRIITAAEDDSVIELTRDYVYGIGDTMRQGIVIHNKNNLTIDGKGFTVNANGKSRVFIVDIGSKNIVFKNINIVNGARLDGGTQDYGAGLIWESSNGYVINCTFENNIGSGVSGGGALRWVGDNGHLINCTFINNTHTYTYGGAVNWYGANAEIINSTFVNNTATAIQGGAGAIYLLNGGSKIVNCTFENNSGRECGAIYDNSHNKIVSKIINCTFIRNIATTTEIGYGGGAIYTYNSSVYNSIFLENQARYGAAIFCNYDACDVDKCIFINNAASSGIVLVAVGGSVKNSIFLNNDVSGAIVSTIWGNLTNKDNWYGNTWNNYNNIPDYSAYNLTNWLFLNVTDLEYNFDSETLSINFNFLKYDNGTISDYDSTKLPTIILNISATNATFNKNTVSINDLLSGKASYKGIIIAEYENVKYQIPFIFKKETWIESDSIFNIIISGTTKINDCVRPFENDYQPFIQSSKTYTSNDTSIVTVDSKGKIKGIKEGIARITIYFNGIDAMGRDKYMPCNKTVIVNVTKIPTNIEFDLDVNEVGNSGNVIIYVKDSNGKSVSGNILVNNTNPEVLSLTVTNRNVIYKALSEGVTNISIVFPETDKYLPSSFNLTVAISKKPAIVVVDTNYIEMNITKYYWIGAYVSSVSSALLIYSSNDTNVVTVNDEGRIYAVGVGIANISIEYEGNDKYSSNVTHVIVNVTAVETHLELNSNLFNLNVSDSTKINAQLKDSNGNVILQLINYESNDTSVATVDGTGYISTLKEGVVNISVVFAGRGEYLPAAEYVIVNVTSIKTDISVKPEVDLYVGDKPSLNATLSPSNAGKLNYLSNDTSVVTVDSNGNLKAISEGIAKITVYYEGSARYVPSQEDVIVNVMRKTSHINVEKIITLYVGENITMDIESVPANAVLNYASSNSDVVALTGNAKLSAIKVGQSNITISYSGSNEYLPVSEIVTVNVVLIPTEIDVFKTVGIKIDENPNINATLNPAVGGDLIYISDDENVVVIDSNGYLTPINVGKVNITIKFNGNDKYASSNVTIAVSVYDNQIPTAIEGIKNKTIVLYVGNETNIGAVLNPENAGVLIYNSTDFDVVSVDGEGNIKAIQEGVANITITFTGNDRYKSSNATVKVVVSKIPTEIHVESTDVTLNLTENTTINANLNPPEAGDLTYAIADSNIISIENGLIIAKAVGKTTITVSYSGNDNYTASDDVIINVTVVTIETNVHVDDSDISLYVDDEVNLNATLSPGEAGDLSYISSNSSVVTVDGEGNLVAIGEGSAVVTIEYIGAGKYLSSNATVKVTVSKIKTQITAIDKITLNLTESDGTNINATLSPGEAGDLSYISSNSSVVFVDIEGKILTVGAGTATITVSYAGNNKYSASELNITVTVVTIPTEIKVLDEISLYVDDEVNLNATLSPSGVGDLIYFSGNSSVVTVDGEGNLVAIGEGSAVVTIEYVGAGKYLSSNATVKVTVSKITPEITIGNTDISLYVDEEVNINATLFPSGIGDLNYISDNETVAIIDENGNIVAKAQGETTINVTFSGNNKYNQLQKSVNVKVSCIPTSINVNSTITMEVGLGMSIGATLSPKIGALNYASNDSDILEVDSNGMIFSISSGKATVTIGFDGNEKYAPSSVNVTVTITKRTTSIDVRSNITLVVEDHENINANLRPISEKLIYSSSNSSVVSVDEKGNLVANSKGSATITIIYEGSIANYPANTTVNVTVTAKPTSINVNKNKISLTVGNNETVKATLNGPQDGRLTFITSNENIAFVDNLGTIYAVGKGTATITVKYAGNDDYLPTSKVITVNVSPISTEINVTSPITLPLYDSIELDAILTPDVGSLNYHTSDSSIAVVSGNGKVTAMGIGTAIITVSYAGNSQYGESFKYVTIYVTLEASHINVADSVDLNVGDTKNLNAVLTPNGIGNLIYTSSDSSVVSVDSNGRLIAIKEGNAVITVKFEGTLQYLPSNATVNVTVTKNSKAIEFISNVYEDSDDASFTVKLPNNAYGSFTVLIDGKEIGTENLEHGSATIAVDNLSPGDHSVTMKYSGDNRYASATNVTTIHIYVLKLDKNKDITILYTGYGYYQVHLTKDTQAMGGKVVTFTVNGKKVTAKTNYLGYAKIKVQLPLRIKPYVVTAKYNGVKVTNKVYVKSILVAKHTSVRKSSAKYLKVKVSLKKVNGKYLSGKKITFNFNGKAYYAKTNSKGVAVFTIYKSTINKLAVGKKYAFIVKFGTDRINKFVSVLK